MNLLKNLLISTNKTYISTAPSSQFITRYEKFLNKEGYPLNMRKSFDFGIAPEVKRWFPKHMSKGQIKMKEMVMKMDCVVEIHDARIPFSGRNPVLQEFSGLKPNVLVLNKMDLIPSNNEVQRKIKQMYSNRGVDHVFFSDFGPDRTNKPQFAPVNSLKKVIHHCIKLVESHARYNRSMEPDIKIMVVGVPNVGKSSFISAARKHFLNINTGVVIGSEPGCTKQVSFKIKVCNNPTTFLIDTPGILEAKISDLDAGMRLAICNTIPLSAMLPMQLADYLLFTLNKKNNYNYVSKFKLPCPTDSIDELTKFVATRDKILYNRKVVVNGLTKVQPTVDQEAVAIKLISFFRKGKLGKIILDDIYEDEVRSFL